VQVVGPFRLEATAPVGPPSPGRAQGHAE